MLFALCLVCPGALYASAASYVLAQDQTTATPPIDLSTPEKAVTSFANAFAHANFDGAVRCVQGATVSDYTRQLATGSKMPPLTVRIDGFATTATGGDSAVVSLTAVFLMEGGKEAFPPRPEKLTLHKGDAGWQIVPMNPAEFKPDRDGMLTGICLLLANPEVALRARQKARDAHAAAESEENPQHLRTGQTARLCRNKSRPPLFVGGTREQAETFSTYIRLKDARAEHPKPFTREDDQFTEAEFKAAMAQAKGRADKLLADGDVQWLPHGTLVKIIDHVQEKTMNERYAMAGKEPYLQVLQDPSQDNCGTGIWQVEVLSGKAKGTTVWAYDVVTTRPDLGDYITLQEPGHPGSVAAVAIDESAGHALPAFGQAASPTATAQLTRLARAQRIVQLPVTQRCFIDDTNEMGDLLIVIPTDGPLKGKHLYINPAEAVLTPP